ncbi:hypothetical protein CVU37_12750 [candidate division BRC1 bacterium HGW-BRC1-1]|jgi:hypothetical protein|nr:MAG: hypothetical protein CVU37_12750 [candidate division BRC1 bacterium HGW-BRC1-1]
MKLNFVRHTILAAMCAALPMLFGCDRTEIVKPLKTNEEVAAERNGEGDGVPTTRINTGASREAKRPERRGRSTSDGRAARPAATRPAPPQEPVVEETSAAAVAKVITMADLQADAGSSDTEGGWNLNSNGMIYTMNIPMTAPIHAVMVESKGQEADGTWPMVELTLYNRDYQKYYYPMNKEYVTWPTYQEKLIRFDTPLPAGTYQMSFRFLNNETVATEGDRNVYFRKMVLYPKQALPEGE